MINDMIAVYAGSISKGLMEGDCIKATPGGMVRPKKVRMCLISVRKAQRMPSQVMEFSLTSWDCNCCSSTEQQRDLLL
jgi:hypothetical protein